MVSLVPVGSLDAIREQWTALAAQCDNLFWTWEWQSLWWRHFGRGRPLLASAVASGGRVIAILPLYLAKERPLRIIRFIGHGHGDYLGPICRPADRPEALGALRQVLAEQRFDLFVGDQVAADAHWGATFGATVLRRAGYPVLRWGGASWDEHLATRSSNFRQRIRRGERRLRPHEVRFRLCDDPACLPADLDALYRLHALRFGRHQDWFCGANEAFHREFAARALEQGWLRLTLLALDGAPVAANLDFRFGGIEFGYQTGRDPAWNDASVGFVLEVHAMRQALEAGVREYRFLQGGEEYKYRLADDDPGLETIGVAGSAAGRVALAAVAGLGRLPPVAALIRRLVQ